MTSARDRAIEIITSELPRGQAYVSPHLVDALRAHPEVLRALWPVRETQQGEHQP